MTNPWIKIGFDTWKLSFDASAVMTQRMAKLALGGAAAQAEAARMISEKMEAALALQMKAATGQLGATPQAATRKVLQHYGKKVRANKRRLSRR